MVDASLGDGFASVFFYGHPANSGEKYRMFGITGDHLGVPDDCLLTMKEARDLLKFLQIHVDQED